MHAALHLKIGVNTHCSGNISIPTHTRDKDTNAHLQIKQKKGAERAKCVILTAKGNIKLYFVLDA